MKKMIILFTLVLASAIIFAGKHTQQKNQEIQSSALTRISATATGNPAAMNADSKIENTGQMKANESRPGVLSILVEQDGRSSKVPSFLHRLVFQNAGQQGC